MEVRGISAEQARRLALCRISFLASFISFSDADRHVGITPFRIEILHILAVCVIIC
jgi:hypothetical protein